MYSDEDIALLLSINEVNVSDYKQEILTAIIFSSSGGMIYKN